MSTFGHVVIEGYCFLDDEQSTDGLAAIIL